MGHNILKELKALSKAGKHEDIIALAEQALSNDPPHSQVPFINCALAVAHMELGNLDDAKAIFLALGVENPRCRYVDALNGYAGLQILFSDFDTAEIYYQKGLNVSENRNSRDGLSNMGLFKKIRLRRPITENNSAVPINLSKRRDGVVDRFAPRLDRKPFARRHHPRPPERH